MATSDVATVPAVDDRGRPPCRVATGEQPGHQLEGALGRRETDPLQSAAAGLDELAQTLEGDREVRAALVASKRVHLVDDDRVDVGEHRPRGGGGDQQVERLGGRHQQIGRRAPHGGPLGLRGVAGAHRDGHARPVEAETLGLLRDAGQWDLQVLVDVDREGAQWRDVDDARPGRGLVFRVGRAVACGRVMGSVGGVDRDEEAGQGLAGAGG